MLRLLIKYDLNVNARSSRGYNYLDYAITRAMEQPGLIDFMGIAKILLDLGLPVNSSDNLLGESTFFRAMNLKNTELISLLIKNGADVTAKFESHGLNALHYASTKKDVTIVDIIEDIILSNGAEIDSKCDEGRTALHHACLSRSDKTISFLIQKGASVGLEDEEGKTPFSLLEPEEYSEEYEESDVPCITAMIKEIAKVQFLNDLTVSKKDMDSIQNHLVLHETFQNCTAELNKMSSKTVKKLANLTKNEEFVSKFEENLSTFTCYQNDLREILENAIVVRDELLVVESRLNTVFHGHFPDTVIAKLANNLTADDLQQLEA